MKYEVTKKGIVGRYVFAFLIIVFGIGLEYFNVGEDFLGFQSVGTWMIYVGFVMLAIVTLTAMNRKKRIVDERMESIAYRASRVTFVALIFGAFFVMIWDGISEINIEYSMFMSYLIAFMMLIYFVAYKILSRYY